VRELGLAGKVYVHSPLPLRDIASVMANADLGVIPKRNDSFGGEAFSTKILEFMALGVPVLAADTRIDRHYFNDGLLRFFIAGDIEALSQAMLNAYHEREKSAAMVARALVYVRENSWGTKKSKYLAIVRSLINAHAQSLDRSDRQNVDAVRGRPDAGPYLQRDEAPPHPHVPQHRVGR
jgi:glycosyltransferase involved in cell wall biosynthesis